MFLHVLGCTISARFSAIAFGFTGTAPVTTGTKSNVLFRDIFIVRVVAVATATTTCFVVFIVATTIHTCGVAFRTVIADDTYDQSGFAGTLLWRLSPCFRGLNKGRHYL